MEVEDIKASCVYRNFVETTTYNLLNTLFQHHLGSPLNNMKFFAIIVLGLAAVAAAAPAPQLDCTRDGFFCEPCVNGKRQCVACADGTGLGLVQDC
ncbi:hypothetical protein CEP51_009112 [Fusarium floridanum]|uniref:Uncharacterized protein n=1 Tax=Fusarium floridanum TaxID=1325733 RepID=A0A428RIR3_9HYPO|nr:hypothetical protein CEP51_009112 [Fusarium floridanum]